MELSKGMIRRQIKGSARTTLSQGLFKAIAVLLLVALIGAVVSSVVSIKDEIAGFLHVGAYNYCNTLSGGAIENALLNFFYGAIENADYSEIQAMMTAEEFAVFMDEILSAGLPEEAVSELIAAGVALPFARILYMLGDSSLAGAIEIMDSAEVVQRVIISMVIILAVSLLFALVKLFVMAPLHAGETNFYIHFSDDRGTPVSRVFAWYTPKRMLKASLLNLAVTAIVEIPLILGFGLGLVCIALTALWPMAATVLAISALALFAAGWVASIVLAQMLAPWEFLMVQYPKASGRLTLKQARELMRGHKWELLIFDLSFLGWHILCGFTFGILYLYVMPYIYVATEKFFSYVYQDGVRRGIVRGDFINQTLPAPLPEIPDFDIDSVERLEEEEKFSAE